MPTNHYVVMAKKDGIDIVVDLTAGQFEQYGFSGPVITTEDNWIHQWQQKLKGRPTHLVKMVQVNKAISSSPFRWEYVNPQDIVPEGRLLQRPVWYKRGVTNPVIHPEKAQPTLLDLYNSTRGLKNSRRYTSIEAETNTAVVTEKLHNLYQDYVAKNPIPLDSEGKPKFTVESPRII